MTNKRILALLSAVLFIASSAFSQKESYMYLDGVVESPSSVVIKLKTYAKSKKTADLEAKCAAIRVLLFDGIPNTIYSKPILSQGTSALHDHSDYFNDLFLNKTSDVIKECKRDTEFNKAVKGEKSTIYTVVVNYIQLKKDVEKNRIKNQLGI